MRCGWIARCLLLLGLVLLSGCNNSPQFPVRVGQHVRYEADKHTLYVKAREHKDLEGMLADDVVRDVNDQFVVIEPLEQAGGLKSKTIIPFSSLAAISVLDAE
jgi:hypothetical protein